MAAAAAAAIATTGSGAISASSVAAATATSSTAAHAAPPSTLRWRTAVVQRVHTLAVDLWGGHRPLSHAAPATLPRRRSRLSLAPSPAAAAAAAAGAASFPPRPPGNNANTSSSSSSSYDQEEDVAVDLDWRPGLSGPQELICAAVALVSCAIVYALARPPPPPAAAAALFSAGALPSLFYWLCMAVLFVALRALSRGAALEDQYKARERAGSELGDPDSKFRFLSGLVVHVKARDPKTAAAAAAAVAAAAPGGASAAAPPKARPSFALHCWHGFGANLWSWSRVQPALADRLGALVTAHDSPAFGLTQRPSDLAGYSLAFNGRLGRLIQDYELATRGLLGGGEGAAAEEAAGGGGLPKMTAHAAAPSSSSPSPPPTAATTTTTTTTPGVRRVLVGHSLGSACAALEAVARPREVAALVLVAPAVLMPVLGGGRSDGRDGSAHEGRWLEALDDSFVAGSGAGAGRGNDADASEAATAAAEAEVGDSLQRQRSMSPSSSSSSSSSAPPPGSLRHKHDDLTLYVSKGTAAAAAAAADGTSPRNSPSSRAEAAATRLARSPLGVLLSRSVALVQAASLLAVLGVLLLLRPLLVLGLRAAVRNKEFWSAALAQAYYDPTRLDEKLVDAYRSPQRVRGWESGMLAFLMARVAPLALLSAAGRRAARDGGAGRDANNAASAATAADGSAVRLDAGAAAPTPSAAARDAAMLGSEDKGLGQRLAAAAAAAKIPVLIVHGAGDKLIPLSNSFRLARAIPGATLAVLQRCGHCPHEERPEAVVDLIARFLGSSAVVSGRAGAV